jgi:hypothetical protein
MPSRHLTLAIVAFWLATVGWFVARDVWPHWRPNEPPPFTIELADEAGSMVPVRWVCLYNGTKFGSVRTSLRYHDADDTFELTAFGQELTLLNLPGVMVQARDFDDRIRITREGELRAMTTDVKLVFQGVGPELTARARLGAEVRGGRLERTFRLDAPVLGTFAPVLEPVPIVRGNVLNPMHPVHRVTGLRPGQHWRQPMTDPRSDIIAVAVARALGGEKAAALPDSAPAALDARVLPELQLLAWEGAEHGCFVIEYRGDLRGDEFTARTWVRQSDGTVLRQQAEAHGDTLVLQRE